jgi:HPt (histidine-containing phosphotransfer) domain-containing protein
MNDVTHWPPTDVAILDESALEAIREVQEAGAPDLIAETVELFLGTTPERLAALKVAVAAGDATGIRAMGHAIKGSCLLLGLTRLGKACEVMELSGAEGKLDSTPLWLDRIESELALATERLARVTRGS